MPDSAASANRCGGFQWTASSKKDHFRDGKERARLVLAGAYLTSLTSRQIVQMPL